MSPEPEEERSSRFEFAKLPAVTSLEDQSIASQVIRALEQLDLITSKKQALEMEEDDLKEKLAELQKKVKLPGFRFGTFCFAAQAVEGRRTLDRMALMENGVPASIIAASYKKGKPSQRCTFKRLENGDE